MQAILNQIDSTMAAVLGNPYMSTGLTLFLVLYAGLAAPNLPPFIASLFENPFFKFLILFLVLIVRNYDPTVALLSVIGFVLSMQALNRHRMFSMAMDLGDALQSQISLKGKSDEDESESESEGEGDSEEAGEGEMSACPKPSANCGMRMYSGCGACGMSGGGCGCSAGEGEAGEEETFDPSGFMGCDKPQPQEVDLVLPPQPDSPTQVAAVLNSQCQYQGPQGMQYPYGYPGEVHGANYGGCDSEL